MTATDSTLTGQPSLRRVLGRLDLALLCVVAVVNLNFLPVIASIGPVVLWLWLLALAFFFWPMGFAVIELSHRFPGEGGVYLWAKRVLGDSHGFHSGWCYWMTNVFYIPTVLFYFVGISAYVMGARYHSLADSGLFISILSLVLLWSMVGLNILGLGVGKWVNNLGGIGTAAAAVGLIALAIVGWFAHGNGLPPRSFLITGADWRLLSTFGVICFSLAGLDLGSIMGDEICNPRDAIPGAVSWGGVASGLLYVGATMALVLALPQHEIGVLQGVLQGVTKMAKDSGIAWLIPPLALVLSVEAAGTASAWIGGSARLPFVAGLDRYLPSALGRLHPRFATPHVALMVQATLASVFVGMSLVGASLRDAYLTLLDLAIDPLLLHVRFLSSSGC